MSCKIRYNGEIIEYCFLNTDSSLSEEDRERIVIGAYEVYRDKKRFKKIKGPNFDGRIVVSSNRYTVGAFSGQKFEVLLDTHKGEKHISGLISKLINHSLN